MDKIYQIYDRLFTLSNLALINLINGLFDTRFPPDSIVDCVIPEFVDRRLDKRTADIFLTVNREHTFHVEAQMSRDNSIVLRVYEYGFFHAIDHSDSGNVLHFAQPVIIYLSDTKNIPEESTLLLEFEGQGTFTYRVKNYVYLNHDITVLNRNKMILLIPFQLLRLRDAIIKNPTKENLISLKMLVSNDIIGSIEANVKVGNLLPEDATELLELTGQLYDQLYPELENAGGADVKRRLDGAWELPNDKYRDRICDLEEQLAEAQKGKAAAEEARQKAEQEALRAQNELSLMKKQLEELTAKTPENANAVFANFK